MVKWKRIVVGDIFHLPSRDINYYRDMLLLWPFLIFSVIGVFQVFDPNPLQRVIGAKCLGLALLTIILARERQTLFLGALGFCNCRFILASVLYQGWLPLIGVAVTGIPFLVALRFWRNHEPSYKWPDDLHVGDMILGFCSLGLGILILRSIQQSGIQGQPRDPVCRREFGGCGPVFPNAVSHTAGVEYDYNTGLVAKVTDARGRETLYTYDAMNRPLTISEPSGRVTWHDYTDSVGSVVENVLVADGQYRTTETLFDGLGRPVASIRYDPAGNIGEAFEYDGNGRKKRVMAPQRSGDPAWTTTA